MFESGNQKAVQILLVEDSETHAAMIGESLESWSVPMRLTIARSLQEARSFLDGFLPDLAIVDLFLPDGSGMELLQQGGEAAYPVVVMTGYGNERAAVEAIKGGALDYVVKSAATLVDMPRVLERSLREWGHILVSRRAREELLAANRGLRAETECRKKAELERDRLFERSSDMFGVAEINGCLKQVNPAWTKTLGWSEEELVGQRCDRLVHPDDRQATCAFVERLHASENRIAFENRYRCKDGTYKWISWNVSSLPEEGLSFCVARDVTEGKRAEEELRAAHRRLQDIIEFLPDATLVIDEEKKVVAWNRAIEEETGVRKEDILGKGNYAYGEALYGKRQPILIDLIGSVDRMGEEKYDFVEKQGDTLFAERFMPNLRGGKGAYLCLKASPLFDPEGNLVGAIESMRDITDRKRTLEELKEANRELDAFVYTVSHDLRTPLSPVIGYASFLMEVYGGRLDEEGRDCLAEIEGQGRKMLALMEDLLSLAKVGNVERPAEPVEVRRVAQEVVATLSGPIAAAGAVVRVDFMPSLHAPATLLAQLFDNLIGNAVRYAATEGGHIEVGGEREGRKVRYTVRDRGPGIPEEERGRIFDVFYRGSTGGKVAGTGVGLATVQKIARLYGGRAWVEETPGGGSTFLVEMEDVGPSGAQEEEVSREIFPIESSLRLFQGGRL